MRLIIPVLMLALVAAAAAQPPTIHLERSTQVGSEFDKSNDAVESWNGVALALIRSGKTPPPVAARNLALLHVAIYDAVVAVEGGYSPFYVDAGPQRSTDASAAASAAAHRTLIALYPDRARTLDRALDEALASRPARADREWGVALGLAVAERVLKWRAKDTEARRSGYTPRAELGRWQPTPPGHRAPLLPEWGTLACFAVADGGPFRPPGPPALDSDAYVESYRAVKALGGRVSRERTREQTEIALFWADGDGTVTPPGHWNQIARSVSRGRQLGLAETARLYALLNVAMADAAMICWDCKYRFDFWRPVTAIRRSDPDWTPLIDTPPFPSYTSGHSSFSGAAAAALAAFFQTDEIAFSTTSDGLPGVTRSFKSFTAAAEEAGMSRIYGGIHWDFDNTAGLKCGRAVGEHVAKHFFGPAAAVRVRP